MFFRESEVDEYSSIKKELEQTGKNCRILSFKLRKTERKAEQLEAEKLESERKSREVIVSYFNLSRDRFINNALKAYSRVGHIF